MPDNSDNRHVRTKIIATIGPASAAPQKLDALCEAGLDVCRINFSHGDHAAHEAVLSTIRAVGTRRGTPLAVIGDLCGPKIRLGTCGTPVALAPGARVTLVAGDAPCTPACLSVSYPHLADEVLPGHRVLIDDGLVRLAVRGRRDDALECEVVVGGVVSSRKGVNLPDSTLSVPALTQKDLLDLDWALTHSVDYIALSFVRQAEDLYELRRQIKARGHATPVIVKIEKPEALEHLDELIESSDAVLVARGDLGVETDLWRVPVVQKDIVARCRRVGVPVIVATQMLQTMIDNPIPTRAEVSDVANAVFDQADAVMLSGETAVGQYPVEAVTMMNRIVAATGQFLAASPPFDPPPSVAVHYRPTAAVAHAAVQAARDLGVRLVAVWSATGTTVRMVANYRLPMPILGLTCDEHVQRQMNLLYGVIPVRVPPLDHPAAMVRTLDALVLERRLAAPGDVIVVVTSTRPTVAGATDTALVHRVGADGVSLLAGV